MLLQCVLEKLIHGRSVAAVACSIAAYDFSVGPVSVSSFCTPLSAREVGRSVSVSDKENLGNMLYYSTLVLNYTQHLSVSSSYNAHQSVDTQHLSISRRGESQEVDD
jgi:hypothetical protein